MSHLSPENLIDLAEGAAAERSAPHLQTCAECRRQLETLRGAMSEAAAVRVPEPSPLFWDHLSARVGETVRADGPPEASWWRVSSWPRFAVPAVAMAFAVALLMAVFPPRVDAPATPVPAPVSSDADRVAPAAAQDDDAVLQIVADLASQMDWESASQVGLAVHQGALDEAWRASRRIVVAGSIFLLGDVIKLIDAP